MSEKHRWEWPSLNEVTKNLNVPKGIEFGVLDGSRIDELIAKISRWYPDIATGLESVHLETSFFENQCHLEGIDGTNTKPVIPIVALLNSQIVALVTFEKHDRAKTISSRLGVVDPEYRNSGIGALGPLLLEALGQQMSAGMVYYSATTKIPHQQILAERAGFSLVGILPAFDLDTVRPGEALRVFEVLYAKILVPPEGLEKPKLKSLTPKTLRLWKFLFDELNPNSIPFDIED